MGIFDRARRAAELGNQAWRFGGDRDLVIARKSEIDSTIERFEKVLAEANNTIAGLETEVIGFRQYGGSIHDMREWDHSRMLKTVLSLYRRDHMARRLLNIIVDFVIGDGIAIQAKHKDESTQQEIKAIIDEFWNDQTNQIERNIEEWCTGWHLWGEICLPIRRNEVDGRVRLGWIDSEAIAKVLNDPFTQRPALIEISDSYETAVGQKTLSVASRDDQTGVWSGDCFFRAMNTVIGQSRGVSELYTSADWFDVLDQAMLHASDRVKLLNQFMWDVTMDDATQEQCDEAARLYRLMPQSPNLVRVHNQHTKWEAIAPQLNSYENTNHAKLLRTHILGGWGYPNHWFGDGSDANLATAAMMSEPTRKALRRKQQQFRWLIQDIIRFVLSSAKEAKQLPSTLDLSVDPFTVQIPDFSGPDIAKVGAAVASITATIQAAEQNGYISHDTAIEMFASVSAETGFEIDPAAEKTKIETDVKTQMEKERQDEEAREVELQRLLATERARPPQEGQADARREETPAR